MAELRFKVEGIACPGCATDMETVLLGRDGISRVDVNYAEETVRVEYNPDTITEKEIVSALVGMGCKPKQT